MFLVERSILLYNVAYCTYFAKFQDSLWSVNVYCSFFLQSAHFPIFFLGCIWVNFFNKFSPFCKKKMIAKCILHAKFFLRSARWKKYLKKILWRVRVLTFRRIFAGFFPKWKFAEFYRTMYLPMLFAIFHRSFLSKNTSQAGFSIMSAFYQLVIETKRRQEG